MAGEASADIVVLGGEPTDAGVRATRALLESVRRQAKLVMDAAALGDVSSPLIVAGGVALGGLVTVLVAKAIHARPVTQMEAKSLEGSSGSIARRGRPSRPGWPPCPEVVERVPLRRGSSRLPDALTLGRAGG